MIQNFQSPFLCCNKASHQGQQINTLCLRTECNQDPAQCHMCTLETHRDCIDSTTMLRDVSKLIITFQQLQQCLIEMQEKINQLIKELMALIELQLQPISLYFENPNLTNLNSLGAYLKKKEQKWVVKNSVMSSQKQINTLFTKFLEKSWDQLFSLKEYQNDQHDQEIILDPKYKIDQMNKQVQDAPLHQINISKNIDKNDNKDSNLKIDQRNNQQIQPKQKADQNQGQLVQAQKEDQIINSQPSLRLYSKIMDEQTQNQNQSTTLPEHIQQLQKDSQQKLVSPILEKNYTKAAKPEEIKINGSQSINKNFSLNKNIEINESNNQQFQPINYRQKVYHYNVQPAQSQRNSSQQLRQKSSEIYQYFRQVTPKFSQHTQQQFIQNNQTTLQNTTIVKIQPNTKTNTYAKQEQCKFSSQRNRDSSLNTNCNQEIIQPNNTQCQSIIQGQKIDQNKGQKEQEQKNLTTPNPQKVLQQLSEKTTEIVQELKQSASKSDPSNQQQYQAQNKKIKFLSSNNEITNTNTDKNKLPKLEESNMKGSPQIDQKSSLYKESNQEIDQSNNQWVQHKQKAGQIQGQQEQTLQEVQIINSQLILQNQKMDEITQNQMQSTTLPELTPQLQKDSQQILVSPTLEKNSQINQAPRQDINDMEYENTKISIQYLDHCDCILLKSDNVNLNFYLVLSKFTSYVGQFNIEVGQKESQGLILQRHFDKNFNSQYFHYQGEFEKDQIVGRGILYNQKSNGVLQKGEWIQIKQRLQGYLQTLINPVKERIQTILEEDQKNFAHYKELNQKRILYSQEKTVFHDQLLYQKDLNILRSTEELNTKIVDSYIEHLNYQDELHYWTLSKEDRKLYQRVYIVPSRILSQFKYGEDTKNFELFKETFSEFKPIQHRIWEIYKKIGFVYNLSNVYWYFVQVDFEKKEILFKDSMRDATLLYNSRKAILQNLLNNIDGKTHQFTLKVCQECKKQEISFDRGAYTCLNAKEFAEGKQSNIKTETEMRKFLLDFIQYKF